VVRDGSCSMGGVEDCISVMQMIEEVLKRGGHDIDSRMALPNSSSTDTPPISGYWPNRRTAPINKRRFSRMVAKLHVLAAIGISVISGV